MNLNLIDQTELLRREHGRTLYEGAEGSVLCSPDGRTVFSDILDIPRLRTLLQALTPPQTDTFSVKSAQAADLVTELFGMTGRTDCAQWVYCRDAAPDFDRSIDIHPMPREDVPLAAPHYGLLGDCTEFFYEQSAAGRLFGLYEGGRLAGFIGLHHEGSMGMLEILPEFRRRGYGFALEAFLIDWHLQRGWVPWCHVIDGNDASTALQKKLGMTRADWPDIWVFRY